MKTKITKQGRLKLAKNSQCVHCKSDQIEGGHVAVEAGEAWQYVQCLDCRQSWTEIYTMTTVEVRKEDVL